MRACAEYVEATYGPWRNASIMTFKKDAEAGIEATCTVNTKGMIMCMQVPSADVAERSIAAVAAKVGDLQPGSLRVVNVMGVCHLGHEADLDYLSLPSTLGGTYEPEIMPYWGGDVDGSTLRVWALGTVRVMSSKTAEMASAACEKLRARAKREVAPAAAAPAAATPAAAAPAAAAPAAAAPVASAADCDPDLLEDWRLASGFAEVEGSLESNNVSI